MKTISIRELLQQYEDGSLTPTAMVAAMIQRLRDYDFAGNPLWIQRVGEGDLLAAAHALEARREAGEVMPLYGVPYAVKDNIDVAGMETTAACPEFGYVASEDAEAVAQLRKAGALLVGKTNLDQFATGLVGVRSPYGACYCVDQKDYISGGSSSGSAVAVAAGLVAFSLGTDTAGSGRVPAAFNGLIGYKGTRGRVSTYGVVPACRSLDCVTVFTADIEGAESVIELIGKFDPKDPFSRIAERRKGGVNTFGKEFSFGVLREDQREFFGDSEAEALYLDGVRRMEELGGVAVPIDYRPFQRSASLLYSGPWVAERTAAIDGFLAREAGSIHPVVRKIIEGGKGYSAVDAFEGLYQLKALRRETEAVWSDLQFLFLPTAPTHYRIDEVLANPVELNSRLGLYTNFVNLMDLAALAIPLDRRCDGRPYGATLIGPAWSESELCAYGKAFLSKKALIPNPSPQSSSIELMVCGAHMRGFPLHPQLLECGAVFINEVRTSANYRLYALSTNPRKPALIRANDSNSGAVDGELYRIPFAGLGKLISQVPAPLCIGTVELESGSWVKGFLGEPLATINAIEITKLGSWRAFNQC
jgi:allophanate hydrolase